MVGPDPQREIYPNAPLKLVTFELRFDNVDLSPESTELFVETVRDLFPVIGPPPHQQFVIGPGGPSANSSGARAFDIARRQVVAFGPQALSFETSRYKRFEDFRESLSRLLTTVEALDLGIAPRRVGLRYIDEIDEEHLPEPRAWDRFIDPTLSSPLNHFDPPPTEHQSAALFEGDDDHKVVLRYGLMRNPAVDPAGPLVIDSPPRGNYFLIDIDSAWEGSVESVAMTKWVLEKVAELHAPVRQLFEESITEELRNKVLRMERSE